MHTPVIHTKRTVSRLAEPSDVENVLGYYQVNRKFLEPFEPHRPDKFFTRSYWKERIRQNQAEFQAQTSCRLFVFLDGSPKDVIGTVNFTKIERHPIYSGMLGYGLSLGNEGKGIMHEALQAVVPFVFNEMRLHKIFAAYMPRNERSGRLLRRLGFTVYGYTRDYLRINGIREDHILTSLTNQAWGLLPEQKSNAE